MSDDQRDFEADIRACVRDFYENARRDDLLAPVFGQWIKDWDKHLATMDDFWSSALLGTDRYKAAPFPPHLKLAMDQRHFDRWGELWKASVARTLSEPLRAKATSIGEHLSHCWGRAYATMTSEKAEA